METVQKDEIMLKCVKCKKEKTQDQGIFMLEGSTFCCKQCCGDPAKGEDKVKKDNVCECC